MKNSLPEFDSPKIRRVYDKDTNVWWFSVADVLQVLMQRADGLSAPEYWNQLKECLSKEGSESATNCHRLKLPAADGKPQLTEVATAETLLRLMQSIPSPKAEPLKLGLAQLGDECLQETADPARLLDRARQTWQQQGRSDEWITQRMNGQEARNKPTNPMTEPELIFAALAELSTRKIAERGEVTGMQANKFAAEKGGRIAAQARSQLESLTGKSIAPGDHLLPPKPEADRRFSALQIVLSMNHG